MTVPDAEPAGGSEADRIRDAVLDVPDVVELSAGTLGELEEQVPGQVPGIRIGEDEVAVHIVASYGQPLREIADEVGRSVGPLLDGRELTVSVEDIRLPGETDGTP